MYKYLSPIYIPGNHNRKHIGAHKLPKQHQLSPIVSITVSTTAKLNRKPLTQVSFLFELGTIEELGVSFTKVGK